MPPQVASHYAKKHIVVPSSLVIYKAARQLLGSDFLLRSTTYIPIGVLSCSTYGRPRQLLLHCSTSYIHIVVP